MLRVFDLIAQVAPAGHVLIQGESGTGKELIAKAIHANSPRKDKPFRPHQHRRHALRASGVYALRPRQGRIHVGRRFEERLFEVANGGTLFLDEIATMGMDTQAKILRVLQDRRFMPPGRHHGDSGGCAHHCSHQHRSPQAVRDGVSAKTFSTA